jgi:hypothetical protein
MEIRASMLTLCRSFRTAACLSVVLGGCAGSASERAGIVGSPAGAGSAVGARPDATDLSRPIPRAPTSVTTADPGTHAYDRDVWQTLLYHHGKIRRTVTALPDGLAAVTESDDPAVATLIKDHALAMQVRMTEGLAIRTWDPVFKELFERHGKVKLAVVLTEKGVSITETTADPETLKLLRAHSAGITDMVREGSRASQRETPRVPE